MKKNIPKNIAKALTLVFFGLSGLILCGLILFALHKTAVRIASLYSDGGIFSALIETSLFLGIIGTIALFIWFKLDDEK